MKINLQTFVISVFLGFFSGIFLKSLWVAYCQKRRRKAQMIWGFMGRKCDLDRAYNLVKVRGFGE